MLKIALRNLVAYKSRTAATGVAVVLGVALLSGTLVLADTARAALRATFADSYAGIDAFVRAETAFSSWRGDQRPRLDVGLVDAVGRVEGVAGAQGRIEGYGQLVDERGEPLGDPERAYAASWTTLEGANPFRVVSGRAPRADGEVVIDRATAETSGYRVGDRAQLVVQAGVRDVTVVGIATFGDANGIDGTSYVLFAEPAARRLVAQEDRVDGIVAVAAPGVSPSELRDRIARAMPDGVEVLTGAQLVGERQGDVEGITSAVRSLLLTFAAVALFVGGYIIHNIFSILVAQRGRQLALLRAVGATRRQVLVAVLAEALLLGLLASTAGAATGVVAASALRDLVAAFGVDIPAGGMVVGVPALLVAIAAGVLLTVASAVLPAARASSVRPVAALRDLAVDRAAPSRRHIAVAALFTAVGAAALAGGMRGGSEALLPLAVGAALIFLAVAALGPSLAPPMVRVIGAPLGRVAGTPAAIARETTVRNPRRTAGAAGALMVGMALVTLISVAAASAKASLAEGPRQADESRRGADFAIRAAAMGFGGIDPELARRLAPLPEVASVTTGRVAVAQVDGDASRHLLGIDPEAWPAMVDVGIVEGSVADLGHDGIVVPDAVARTKGWRIGDAVPVRFAATGDRELRIVATTREGMDYLVSLGTYEANVADQFDAIVYVEQARQVRADDTRAAIESVLADFPTATLVDASNVNAAQREGIDRFANLVYILLVLVVGIALLGIANTLALAVVERTRELGLLRAVGMTRDQVRAMVRWESVMIALLGIVLGLVVGLFFAWVIVQALPDTDTVRVRVPVGQLAAMSLVAGTAALAAAAGPARRAARLDVLDALAES